MMPTPTVPAWKVVLRLFLAGLPTRALHACKPRSARTIAIRVAGLNAFVKDAQDKGTVYRELTMMRTDEDWPADLEGWSWWDKQIRAMQNMLLEVDR